MSDETHDQSACHAYPVSGVSRVPKAGLVRNCEQETQLHGFLVTMA